MKKILNKLSVLENVLYYTVIHIIARIVGLILMRVRHKIQWFWRRYDK